MSTTTHQAVTTAEAPAPVGPYNQAVQAGGWLYCSGQIPLDPATGEMVGDGDVEAETRQVLSNLQAVLSAAGTEAASLPVAVAAPCANNKHRKRPGPGKATKIQKKTAPNAVFLEKSCSLSTHDTFKHDWTSTKIHFLDLSCYHAMLRW